MIDNLFMSQFAFSSSPWLYVQPIRKPILEPQKLTFPAEILR